METHCALQFNNLSLALLLLARLWEIKGEASRLPYLAEAAEALKEQRPKLSSTPNITKTTLEFSETLA